MSKTAFEILHEINWQDITQIKSTRTADLMDSVVALPERLFELSEANYDDRMVKRLFKNALKVATPQNTKVKKIYLDEEGKMIPDEKAGENTKYEFYIEIRKYVLDGERVYTIRL